MDEIGKLAHLLPHWIEHNESHAAQFDEWSEKARSAGLSDVADHIDAAAAAARIATAKLTNARASLPDSDRHGHD